MKIIYNNGTVAECPEEEKVFLHDESHLYLTPTQAQELVNALDQAIKLSSFTKK